MHPRCPKCLSPHLTDTNGGAPWKCHTMYCGFETDVYEDLIGRPEIKTLYVRGIRPERTPNNRLRIHPTMLIFNAHREIHGSMDVEGRYYRWKAGYIYGEFFAAVSPYDYEVMDFNKKQNARILEYVCEEEVLVWYLDYMKENGYDMCSGLKITIDMAWTAFDYEHNEQGEVYVRS